MSDELIRIILLIAIASIYAYFDVFNKREIPNVFAYASVAIAILAAALLGGVPYDMLFLILGLAVFGYVAYRKGFIGGGDIFELLAITLLLPLQPLPYLISVAQLGLPFILSVFIASGYASIIIILIYYLIFAKRTKIEKNFKLERRRVLNAVFISVTYIMLAFLLFFILRISIFGAILLIIMALLSSTLMAYEKLINYRMIKELEPSSLTLDDMIAVNLMSNPDIEYFKLHSKHFGRLATKEMLKEVKHLKKKLPVYRNAVPLAAFIFIGILISLLFGNLILLII